MAVKSGSPILIAWEIALQSQGVDSELYWTIGYRVGCMDWVKGCMYSIVVKQLLCMLNHLDHFHLIFTPRMLMLVQMKSWINYR